MSRHYRDDGVEIVSFADKPAMHSWMEKNHDTVTAVWLKMYKKASGIPSVAWKDAVEVCLCWGWIDGVANSLDDTAYYQRLTPRRPKGNWSMINVENATKLIASGQMRPSGQAQVDAAKADGRWDQAYASPAAMKVPEDFIAAVTAEPDLLEAFNALKKTSLYTIGYQLTTAKKPETRERRFRVLINKLRSGAAI